MIDKNKKILVLVESPTKTKAVKKIMQEIGYTDVEVLATVGHTTKIKDEKKSYKNTGIYPEENFRASYAVDENKRNIVDKIKTYAKKVDIVLIASDPDREGENLGNHILQLLKLPEHKYYRITYNSITKDAIEAALENPTKMNKNLCEAAEARQIIDKLVGYSLSPVAKTYIGARSVGRCQSAGLKLIVDREKEIANFIPEIYYDLYVKFKKNNNEYKAIYIGTQDQPVTTIKDAATLSGIKFGCNENFVIKSIKKTVRKENPKPPFCTATFQQEVANRLGLSVHDAMKYAQKLFEGITINGVHKGLITYMRTDSTAMAPEFLKVLKTYVAENFSLAKFIPPKVAKKTGLEQEGHECIRVVDPSITPDIVKSVVNNDLLAKIYTIIWQRTVAAVLPATELLDTTYTISNNAHLFQFKNSEVTDLGYKTVYKRYNIGKKDSQQTVDELSSFPEFSEGEILHDAELEDFEKITRPPARYKEASFIKELQEQGIGRPSTYATIVETVLSAKRGYCTLVEKELVPTEKGIQLSNFLDRAFSNIINIDYTKTMEDQLDLIAKAELNKLTFLTAFFNNLETAIAQNKETPIDVEQKLCPDCGATMVIRRSRYGKLFYGCSRYPSCRGVVNYE